LNSYQHIPEEDLALYALQALTPEERQQAQAHLDTCAQCRAGLAEAFSDISLIGISVEQQPLPEGARSRFLNSISKDKKNTQPEIRSIADARAPMRQKSYGWVGWLAAAACLAIAAYFGNRSFELQQHLNIVAGQTAELEAKAEHAQQLMDVLTAQHATQVTLTETKQTPQPTGHATYLPQKGALIFVGNNLRALPATKTYELWLIPANGKAPIPAGLFRPDSTGTATVVLPPLPQGVPAKAFGVTIEQLEGSATPTLPIILSGQ
jgi:anti-sigma-K factor RskA